MSRDGASEASHEGRATISSWLPRLWLWHVASYALVGVVAVIIVSEPSTAVRPAWLPALGGAGALLVAWYTVLAFRPPRRGGHVLALGYLTTLAPVLGFACYLNTLATLLLTVGFAQAWYLTRTWRQGAIASGWISAAVWCGMSARGGFAWPAPLVFCLEMAGAFVVSLALGGWLWQIVRESEQRAHLLATLERAQDELAQVHRAEGVAAERQRLAAEVHDTVAQGLGSIVMLAQAAQVGWAESDPATPQRLALIEQTARENLAEARAFIAGHAPARLGDDDLAGVLDRLVQRFEAETGLTATIDVAGDLPLSRENQVVLLRAAQEALANVRRHARATSVTIQLTADAGVAHLTVEDDGIGLGADAAGGYGLEGLRARVAAAGGSVSLGPTRPGAPRPGASVSVALPMTSDVSET